MFLVKVEEGLLSLRSARALLSVPDILLISVRQPHVA